MPASDPRLEIITDTLRQPLDDVAPADLIVGRPLGDNPESSIEPWMIEVNVLALKILQRLAAGGYFTPTPGAAPAESPVAQAEQAKRRRDIGGEIGALMAGDQALRNAAWYPAQAGDLLTVHHPETARMTATGDTYVVVKDDAGDLVLQHLLYSGPADTAGGWYAPGTPDEPFYEPWMEAGPERLVIVRDGRVVHDGPTAAAAAAVTGR